jgi:hypothetical protein
MMMAAWVGEILDVKGAFLHGGFDKGKNVYMKVPEGFEKYYDPCTMSCCYYRHCMGSNNLLWLSG